MPAIAVAPAQGRTLQVLARAISARRILEIGTLAGYSAIWLARALPADGRLVTLEIDPERALVARENLARAGLSERSEVVVGPAADSLEALIRAKIAPFDMIFIDADKRNCPLYLKHSLALARTGSLIVVDNAISRGRLIDPSTGDPDANGLRAMMELVSHHPRLEAACVQTVGAKGYDGFLIATVVEERIGAAGRCPCAPTAEEPTTLPRWTSPPRIHLKRSLRAAMRCSPPSPGRPNA
jgi:predicted O-methyltransferase YrrM